MKELTWTAHPTINEKQFYTAVNVYDGIKDSKGRIPGHRFLITPADITNAYERQKREGQYKTFSQLTRNGKDFGAFNINEDWFDTVEEAMVFMQKKSEILEKATRRNKQYSAQ